MQHWSKLDHQEGVPRPVKRSFHVAVCLGYGGDNPKLLVTGGRDANSVALSDVWILDLDSRKWKEVRECDLLSDKLNTSPELCHNDESIPNVLHQTIDMCPYFAVADIHSAQLSCSSVVYRCIFKYMHDVQVQVPSLQSRFGHCAAASTISPGMTEVVMFGGSPEWPESYKTYDDFKKLSMTTVLRFGEAPFIILLGQSAMLILTCTYLTLYN